LLAACPTHASSQPAASPPPAGLDKLEQWHMPTHLYILGSKGAPYQGLLDALRTDGILPGYLGAGMGYIFERLPWYRDEIHRYDTLILFNINAEDFSRLDDWPNDDR